MALIRLDHDFSQFLLLKIDMAPLQCHNIDNTESTGMEGKEEHFQKFLTARFCTGIVIFQQRRHLFL